MDLLHSQIGEGDEAVWFRVRKPEGMSGSYQGICPCETLGWAKQHWLLLAGIWESQGWGACLAGLGCST